MKKLLLFFILFMLFVGRVDASVNSASSYILMDMDSGRVLLSKDKDSKRLIASITKIMTCVIAIESGKLDDNVLVDDIILKSYGSSIYVEIGEELTLMDLLYGLMLRSGNDAALVIAKYVGGDIDSFVRMMNDKAKDIGMKNTSFVNPSGLDNSDGGNYSTAYDMAILTRYAMKYDSYRKIVSTKSYTLKTNKKTYIWKNKNKLLSESYITGGKTGYTEKAKRTLVSTGSKNNMNFIVVTIRDSDDWNTHKYLYNYAFNNYVSYKILDKNNFKIDNDKTYKGEFYIKNDVYIPLLNKELSNISSEIELIGDNSNYHNGSKVGIYKLILNRDVIYEEDIYIKIKSSKKSKYSFFKGLF